jgi:hypothetical protein
LGRKLLIRTRAGTNCRKANQSPLNARALKDGFTQRATVAGASAPCLCMTIYTAHQVLNWTETTFWNGIDVNRKNAVTALIPIFPMPWRLFQNRRAHNKGYG